ncbi:hypothetical protein L6164_015350 [Bauhinia variegata]|uniref:Uncharacterized protein n=1 Tax=Bauhinia variegata TaxID=167791 RepID=A0ACB9NM96_BAUVA|nr:hypothetical protein L6164_015350 [Bauhinia variegata]
MDNLNNSTKVLKLPFTCQVKVHRPLCLKLEKLICRTLVIIEAIEAERPNCALAIQALCSLHFSLDKAKLVIQHCSESSKLYLAITARRIFSRCEKIRSALELYLSQIQNAVPKVLAAKISEILDDLRAEEFSVDILEDKAGKAIRELLEKDFSDSDSIKSAELVAVQIATRRLNITSSLALLDEKTALKRQLDKVNETNQREKERLKYLLYLLVKYGKFIRQLQTGSSHEQRHECDHKSVEVAVDDAVSENQADENNIGFLDVDQKDSLVPRHS